MPAFFVPGSQQNRFLRSARPHIDIADRVAWRYRAHVSDGHVHVLFTDIGFDQVKHFEADLFGNLEPRAGRSFDAKLKTAGVAGGKYLAAEDGIDDAGAQADKKKSGEHERSDFNQS